MSILIRFRVEVEDLDAMHRVIDRVVNSHFQVSFNVDMADHVEPDDDEAAIMAATTEADVMEALSARIAQAKTPEEAITAMAEAHDSLPYDSPERQALAATMSQISDDTPPHGIKRPKQKRGRPVVRPEAWTWYVDPSKAPTQGSGPKTRGIENVPCPDCKAPVGEPCATFDHGAYRDGYGHAARREEFAILRAQQV